MRSVKLTPTDGTFKVKASRGRDKNIQARTRDVGFDEALVVRSPIKVIELKGQVVRREVGREQALNDLSMGHNVDSKPGLTNDVRSAETYSWTASVCGEAAHTSC